MPRVAAVRDEPSTLWAALSPLLAGQSRIRLSRDGGKSYPQRYERDLTEALPSHPAAVRIYGIDGTCRAIFLDFDSSVDGVDRVDADVRRAQAILHSAGARWIEDYSPNGGRHLYVPLSSRVPFHEARNLVEALALKFRSLDPTPHQNLHHGCMRTPGSRHKTGGHQMLAMSLAMAYDVACRPNPESAWENLLSSLADELAQARRNRAAAVEVPAGPAAETGTASELPKSMLAAATHGLYDPDRYRSPSEARQAVLLSAAAAGMSLVDVDQRIKQGIWPGLAQFYARYAPRHRFASLKRDWVKALSYLKSRPGKPSDDSVHKSPTSQPSTQPQGYPGLNSPGSASEYQYVRNWLNALALLEHRYSSSRSGMARRMILRALGAAANMSGNRFVEFGVRSLAVASGVDHTTVASHLRELRAEADPLVTLVERGRGVRGDLYLLSIPACVEAEAMQTPWRKGRIHSLRPVFRALGMPAAFVYEALEHSPGPVSTTMLARVTGFSRTTVTEALEILAAWRIVQRSGDLLWSVNAGTSLALLAERLGVLEAVAARIARYRAERLAWRTWLAGRGAGTEPVLPSPADDYPWEEFEGPPDDWTLADLAFAQAGPPLHAANG